MDTNPVNCFSFNYKNIVADEIALEGLEGIGFDLLWRRVEKRISSPVTAKMKPRFWNWILNSNSISLYRLPEPLPYMEIYDRFSFVHEETGQLMEPPETAEEHYIYCPIKNEYGSCVHYHTRTPISKQELLINTYEEIVTEYGDTLIMVASLEERWKALAPHAPIIYAAQLSPVRFCILELIGKSRGNGQMTVGKATLLKIISDAKLLFYNRNVLQQLDLIRPICLTQVIDNRGCKSILLRLKRFHQSCIMSMPKFGKIHDIIQYLLKQPDYSEKTEVAISKNVLTAQQSKKLWKTSTNIFGFEDRLVVTEHSKKNRKPGARKRYITLNPPSDESSQSEGETTDTPIHSNYKIGVNIMRQAHEQFTQVGLKGFTQAEIAQVLNIEFYTARSICRLFKSKNLVREFLEDRGKQRITRYIAVNATREIDSKIANEKKKFMDFLDSNKNTESNEETHAFFNSEIEDGEVPKKKIKLEHTDEEKPVSSEYVTNPELLEEKVQEVKVLDGLKNRLIPSFLDTTKKSLRQLKMANAVLEILQEKLAVSGYQTLSTIAAKTVGEPPLDTKSFKVLMQKLVNDGQVKVLKIRWPNSTQMYSTVFCKPQVKLTDPIIRGKYKEICLRSVKNCDTSKSSTKSSTSKVYLTTMVYPRYAKIRKLHEFLFNLAYCQNSNSHDSDVPEGFITLAEAIPEMPVELALSYVSPMSRDSFASQITSLDLVVEKLKNVPTEVFKTILVSKTFQNTIRDNERVLAMLGLVQLLSDQVRPDARIIRNNMIFVNRRTKILDTTGLWPRDNVHKEALQKSYHFQSFDDVQQFWNDVQSISMKTTITMDNAQRLPKKKLIAELHSMDFVTSQDCGQPLGDGCGVCGFDSRFYMDLARHWTNSYFKLKKNRASARKKPIISMPKKQTKTDGKRKVIKKTNRSVPLVKKPVDTVRFRHRSSPKKVRRELMKSKWTKEEDMVLMLCKTAVSILGPLLIRSLRTRNLVARDILSIWGSKKPIRLIHQRCKTMDKDKVFAVESECLINDCKHRPHLINKYEYRVKQMRIMHAGNMSEFEEKTRLLLMEFVWTLYQLMKSKNYKRKVPRIALDLDDFRKKFTIIPSTVNENKTSAFQTPITEPTLAAIKEGIVLSMLFSLNNLRVVKTRMTETILEMFRHHHETLLRSAIDQLRKSGVIAMRVKDIHNYLYNLNLQEMVQTTYKVAAVYQRKWICRLNSDFADNLNASLDMEQTDTGVKGSAEINCMLFELNASNAVDLESITVPVIAGSSRSVLQEEQLAVAEMISQYKLKSGTCGWKKKANVEKFSQLYQGMDLGTLKSLSESVEVVQYKPDSQMHKSDDKIVSYLKDKKLGSTFRELQENTGFDTKTLVKKLEAMESKHLIKRVGHFENVIILTEFSEIWTLKLNEEHIIPVPWLNINREIRYDIFIQWAGVVMNKVFECPGCSIFFLSETCEYLSARSVQDICTFLEKYECVTLHVLSTTEPDLFTDDIPEMEEFNPYERVHSIVVFPVKNCLTKFAFIKCKFLETLII